MAGRVGRFIAAGLVGVLAAAIAAPAATAGSYFEKRTTHYIRLTIDETPGTALFDDSSGEAVSYKNGYTFINDYLDPAASDEQFFAPGDRFFKLDISGQASEAAALKCAMYKGKDSSLSTRGAPFFEADTSAADTTLKCATPDKQLYEVTYTDCVQVTRGVTADARWVFRISASSSCVPAIKNGRKTLPSVSVPFAITAEQA